MMKIIGLFKDKTCMIYLNMWSPLTKEGRKIVRSDNLRKHMESIPEGRTFKCEMCFKTCITSEELDQHTEFIHEGKKFK